MNGNIFLRTSVVFLCIGIGLGLYMGGTHDFTQMPTHAHLNLVGGVLMFLAGLFYNTHPQLSRKVTLIHYAIAVIGLVIFSVIFIIAALSFFPALTLGPLAEYFSLY